MIRRGFFVCGKYLTFLKVVPQSHLKYKKTITYHHHILLVLVQVNDTFTYDLSIGFIGQVSHGSHNFVLRKTSISQMII